MNVIYWTAEWLSVFIETFACFIFCGTFISREKITTRKRNILLLSLISAVVIMAFRAIPLSSVVSSVFAIALFFTLQCVVYYKPLKSLIFTVAFFAILVSVEACVIYSMAYVSGLSTTDVVAEHSPIRLIVLTLTKALLSVLIYVIYKLTVKSPDVPKRYTIFMFAFSLLTFVLMFIFLFRDIQYDTENQTVFPVMLATIILVLIIFLFFGAVKLAEYYENKQQALLLSMRNKMLEESMQETERTFFLWKASLHDHKHKILHLMTLAENDDISEIKAYLKKENDLLAQRLFYYKTGNDSIDTIINVKQSLAYEKGIDFLINATIPAKCRIDNTHLCILLGNLIDNAINASENEQEPYIEVNIKQIKDFLLIKISNRFTKTSQKPVKSQRDRVFHGIGLKSIHHIVADYDGVFTTTIENDTYTAELMIPL